jgi:hypothetical protein
MGWGLDGVWTRLMSSGIRFGIIDAAPIRHPGAIGTAKSQHAESGLLKSMLERLGHSNVDELARTIGRPRFHRELTPP